ncbi:hypothetical protein [Streptomyces sp. AF1A]|uniref:hypothetical protein n=1 Tax=Streptomyces sp. AF1A TaxID=3394350 RepID=UPI0039BD3FF8
MTGKVLIACGTANGSTARIIPLVPGVQRAMDRLGVEERITFGGCLREGARGGIAACS